MSKKKRVKTLKNVKNYKKNSNKEELSRSKRILFWVFLILIPVIFFILLEAILVIFDYGGKSDLFVDTLDKEQKIYLNINPDVAKRYFSSGDFVPSPRVTLFHKNKPLDSYRIFIMGGSTAAGYPYGNNLNFGKILHKKLIDTFPDKKIEIINTAMTAINTYSVWDFMDEVIEQKPDAILIYSGHNEFYGALGVASMESIGKYPFFVKIFLHFQKFRTSSLIREAISKFTQLFSNDNSSKNLKQEETAMAKLAKDQSVKYGSEDYELGKNQFRENLSEIVEIAQNHNVEVILSELVCNVKDLDPFSNKSDAQKIYRDAKDFESMRNYSKAYELYHKAKDYDEVRFRAPEHFNLIIHEISELYKVPVVPMKSYFEKKSPNGLIGNNLMHEHLHPKKEGYFLMANAFYNTMKKNNFISTKWSTINKNYSRGWGFTDLDSVHAKMSIVHLMGDWPFDQSGNPNDALAKMPKQNYIDSLAYEIHYNQDFNLERGHLELGKYYESKGEYRKALLEYIALTYIMPNGDVFYEPAIKLLSKTRNYKYAIVFLEEALKFHKSDLIFSWLGQFSTAVGKYKKAIGYLERGIKSRPKDILVLNSLAISYYRSNMIEKGDQIVRTLELINPSLKQIIELKKIRASVASQ